MSEKTVWIQYNGDIDEDVKIENIHFLDDQKNSISKTEEIFSKLPDNVTDEDIDTKPNNIIKYSFLLATISDTYDVKIIKKIDKEFMTIDAGDKPADGFENEIVFTENNDPEYSDMNEDLRKAIQAGVIKDFLSNIQNTDILPANLKQYYKKVKYISSGGFGNVQVWQHNKNNTQYAVKQILYVTNELKKSIKNYTMIFNEINILDYLKKTNNGRCRDHLLCFKGAYDDIQNGIFYIATEFHDEITLRDFIKIFNKDEEDNQKDAEDQKKIALLTKVLSQIFVAIQNIHDLNIFHRDLKPANILLCNLGNTKEVCSENPNVKIIDFGLSCLLDNYDEKYKDNICNKNSIRGTNGYIDPILYLYKTKGYEERAKHQIENNSDYIKCDYWALGIIFIEIIQIFKYVRNVMISFVDSGLDLYKYYYNNYTSYYLEKDYFFKQILPISDIFFENAIENVLPFTRIENLLNPLLSERYILVKEDMEILKIVRDYTINKPFDTNTFLNETLITEIQTQNFKQTRLYDNDRVENLVREIYRILLKKGITMDTITAENVYNIQFENADIIQNFKNNLNVIYKKYLISNNIFLLKNIDDIIIKQNLNNINNFVKNNIPKIIGNKHDEEIENLKTFLKKLEDHDIKKDINIPDLQTSIIPTFLKTYYTSNQDVLNIYPWFKPIAEFLTAKPKDNDEDIKKNILIENIKKNL